MNYTTRLFLISLFLVLIAQLPFFSSVRSFCLATLAPIQYGTYSVRRGLSNYIDFIINIGNLQNEKDILEKQLLHITGQVASLKEESYENSLLKQQLDLSERDLETKCQANVVGTNSVGSELLLDCGSLDGISSGDIAVLGNQLLGLVVDVQKETCLVRLITHPNSAVAVFDQDSIARVQGIVQGQVGSGMVLTKVLPTAEVNQGDYLLTSGYDGVFPYGLLVGKVGEVKFSEAGLLKEAYVESFIDFSNFTHIFIVS